VIVPPGVRLRLQDILDAIVGIRETVGDAGFETYVSHWSTRRAVERGVEIISEASRHVPDPAKARHPDVSWREIAGIGNVLRHDYHRIDDLILWRVVKQHLGPLEAAVRELLDEAD
jgi:uncharacterized protein with HEPN domain